MKYEETKNKLDSQVRALQEALQKTREEKISALRSNKQSLLDEFRLKEKCLEE